MAFSQNKTEYFFGVFGLFLFARKALCTFGMLVVALSDDSERLSKTGKRLDCLIAGCFYA